MGEDGFWTGLAILFFLRVLPWIFVAAGVVFLFLTWRFLSGAVAATGRVVELHRSTSIRQSTSSGSTRRVVTTFKPVFEYPGPDGLTERAETTIFSTRFEFPVGSEREILVNPAFPGQARMPGAGNYALGAVLLGIGLLFGIVGILAPI